MFDFTSRYYTIETATYTLPDGREVAYKRRRIIPASETMTLIAQVTVMQSDRLDLIAARTIGDPTQFWHIADANDAILPEALIETPGRVLRIAQP